MHQLGLGKNRRGREEKVHDVARHCEDKPGKKHRSKRLKKQSKEKKGERFFVRDGSVK